MPLSDDAQTRGETDARAMPCHQSPPLRTPRRSICRFEGSVRAPGPSPSPLFRAQSLLERGTPSRRPARLLDGRRSCTTLVVDSFTTFSFYSLYQSAAPSLQRERGLRWWSLGWWSTHPEAHLPVSRSLPVSSTSSAVNFTPSRFPRQPSLSQRGQVPGVPLL